MKPKLLIGILVLSVLGCRPLAVSEKGPPETKDRLSPERMERMVKGPMRLVDEGRLDDGKAEFQKILGEARAEHGPNSVEVADLLSSFGVQLFIQGSDEARQASREYLEQAIPAFRAAFGAKHPEVAVALNDLASVEKVLSPEDPPPAVEDLLREALRIRAAKLGPNNPETRATMTYLANVYALPAWIKRNPHYFGEADALYRRAMVGAGTGPEGDTVTNGAAIRVRLAKLYALEGHQKAAIEIANQSWAISKVWPAKPRCDLVESQLIKLADTMAENGATADAAAIKAVPKPSACARMTEPNLFEQFLDALGIR